jgi:hypothetical protein
LSIIRVEAHDPDSTSPSGPPRQFDGRSVGGRRRGERRAGEEAADEDTEEASASEADRKKNAYISTAARATDSA